MSRDVNLGILMSSGPDDVMRACDGVAGVQMVGMLKPDDLAPHAAMLDALIVSNDFYTPEVAKLVYEGSPRLRWLQSSSTGWEHLAELGAPKHLAVTEPGSVYSDIVAEHGVAMLLALARGILPMERARPQHRWDFANVARRMFSLKDRKLLAVGFGGIGRETARRVRGFGMEVTAMVRRAPPPEAAGLADHLISREQLHETLPNMDVVVLGIPSNAGTKHLMGKPEFDRMKPGAVLINLARGPVVDEPAMIEALRDGRLGGAGLDVFWNEPLEPESPLWDMPNVVISPHLSAYGDGHGGRKFGALIRENLQRFIAGQQLLNGIEGYKDRAPLP